MSRKVVALWLLLSLNGLVLAGCPPMIEFAADATVALSPATGPVLSAAAATPTLAKLETPRATQDAQSFVDPRRPHMPTDAPTTRQPIPEGVQLALDAVLTHLHERGGAQAPPPGLSWTAQYTAPAGLGGVGAYRFSGDGWVFLVTYPVVAPEATVYAVEVTNPAAGFYWEGEVDAQGRIKDRGAGPANWPAVAWYGYVISLPAGTQLDDVLVLHPEGTGEIGLAGTSEDIEAQIIALRDRPEPDRNAHFWGSVSCGVPDANGCRLLVERLWVDGQGPRFLPQRVEDWEGTIHSVPAGARSGGDDYLLLAGEFPIQYGIDTVLVSDSRVGQRVLEVRDTGRTVRVSGVVVAGVPDWNATQIQVTELEVLP